MSNFKYKAYTPKSKGGRSKRGNHQVQLPPSLDKISASVEERRRVITQSEWFKDVDTLFNSLLSRENWPVPNTVIALGLGSFESNVNAIDQLILLQYLIDRLQIDSSKVTLFDPVSTELDIDFVTRLGYKHSSEYADSVEASPTPSTLLYMPHCDKSLYEESLGRYWRRDRLSRVVLLGNDLSLYSQRQKDTSSVSLVTKYIAFSEATHLPNPPEDLLNSFNELCVQYVPSSRTKWLSGEYWGDKHFFTSCQANRFYLTPLSNSPTSVVHLPLNRRIAWKKLGGITPMHRLRLYKQLSKARLTFLVTLTSMAGYALCPDSSEDRTLRQELSTLLSTAVGVTLCSASANSFNQMLEVPLDSQMVRTRIRPLCTRVLSPIHAVAFGVVTGITGVGILSYGVNDTSALLGAFNILLYSAVYTPLKRVHAVNTWIGSIVGAIPPLIGWTASSGRLLPERSDSNDETEKLKDIAAVSALPYLLYTWQFPHFNSLAHLLRPQYAASGYRMLSVSSPLKNSLVSTRHALLMLPLTAVLFPWSGITTWNFAYTSTLLNAPFAYLSIIFYRNIKTGKAADATARRLFHASLIHLPLTLVLAMYHKRSSNHIDKYMGSTETVTSTSIQV